MGHISASVEYGLHCLLFLAGPRQGGRASARDLAALQGAPAHLVAKIFTRLRMAGLVAATEGVAGGFRLARPAADISVLDVVDAIDGPKPLFACNDVRERCLLFAGNPPAWATDGRCTIHQVMVEAETRLREVLAAHSLGDLATRVDAKAPAAYRGAIIAWLDGRVAARRSRRRRKPPRAHAKAHAEKCR